MEQEPHETSQSRPLETLFYQVPKISRERAVERPERSPDSATGLADSGRMVPGPRGPASAPPPPGLLDHRRSLNQLPLMNLRKGLEGSRLLIFR